MTKFCERSVDFALTADGMYVERDVSRASIIVVAFGQSTNLQHHMPVLTWAEPKSSCQERTRRPAATTKASETLPATANCISAATIVAGHPVICPSSIRKPSPLLAPMSSAAITNIQPSARPARSPVT